MRELTLKAPAPPPHTHIHGCLGADAGKCFYLSHQTACLQGQFHTNEFQIYGSINTLYYIFIIII